MDLAASAHNITTRLAALPVLLERYRLREDGHADLIELNNHFFHVLKTTSDTMKRMKKLLTPVFLQGTTFDLVEFLTKTFETMLPANMWSLTCQPRQIQIFGDVHALENACTELIQNSIGSCGEIEDVKIEIVVQRQRTLLEDWIKIEYKDHGSGIPIKFKERVFEDFFSHRPGMKTGTGLGLGFVKRVIEAHGGSIVEKGKPDCGALFIIRIPQGEHIN